MADGFLFDASRPNSLRSCVTPPSKAYTGFVVMKVGGKAKDRDGIRKKKYLSISARRAPDASAANRIAIFDRTRRWFTTVHRELAVK